MNISITTEKGAFYDQNFDLDAAIVNTEFYVEKIIERA